MDAASLVESFKAQFRQEAGGWVFRERSFGPAIPLTAAEKDLFIAGFENARARQMRTNRIISVLLLSPLLLVKIIRPELVNPHFAAWAYAAMLPLIWLNAISDHFCVKFPTFALAKRLSVSPAVCSVEAEFLPSRGFGLTIWIQPVMSTPFLSSLARYENVFFDWIFFALSLALVSHAIVNLVGPHLAHKAGDIESAR
jgi:hypothetical protein